MKELYTEGLPPGMDPVVSMDFEIFRQGEPLFRPTGDLACLAITTQKGNYLVYTQAEVRAAVKMALKHHSIVAMHHSAYDQRYFAKFGADTSKLKVWDTEIGAKVQSAGLYSTFGLDDLVRRAYGIYLEKGLREEFGTLVEMGPQHKEYAARDARFTRALAIGQMASMEPQELSYYWLVEEPALRAVLRLNPIPVDQDYWLRLADEYTRKRDAAKASLGFNPGSWQQIKDQVSRAHGIDLPDTSEETLLEYAGYYMVDRILEFKAVDKGATTYGPKWLEKLLDGCVVPDWSSFGTETGRMSCKWPNMQQVPVRVDKRYRYAFPASKGRVRSKTDADQQEIRVLAFFSKARALMTAFQLGISTHLVTGRTVLGIPDLDKKHEKYRLAKDINLGIGFGLEAPGLSRKTGGVVSEIEAAIFIRKYFQLYPENQLYITRSRSSAMRFGYVRTASERKIWVNLHNQQWENNAINARIQGTAAEITKLAMVRGMALLEEASLPQVIDMVIHDELGTNAPKKEAKKIVKIIEQAWQEAAATIIPGVPFATETDLGPTWGGVPEVL